MSSRWPSPPRRTPQQIVVVRFGVDVEEGQAVSTRSPRASRCRRAAAAARTSDARPDRPDTPETGRPGGAPLRSRGTPPGRGVRAAPVPTVRREQVTVRSSGGRRPGSQVRPSAGSTAASTKRTRYSGSAYSPVHDGPGADDAEHLGRDVLQRGMVGGDLAPFDPALENLPQRGDLRVDERLAQRPREFLVLGDRVAERLEQLGVVSSTTRPAARAASRRSPGERSGVDAVQASTGGGSAARPPRTGAWSSTAGRGWTCCTGCWRRSPSMVTAS